MAYYNTTNLSGADLKDSTNSAMKQEERIHEFYKANANREITPFEVEQELYSNTMVPITSIRRAITNLTTEDKLIKTSNVKTGPYGKPSYCWKLNV
jgi:transcription initiation factor IIE alpha subunit